MPVGVRPPRAREVVKTKVVYNCRDRDQKKLRDSISCLMSPPRYLRSGHRKGKMEEKDIFPSILLFGLGAIAGQKSAASLPTSSASRSSVFHSLCGKGGGGGFLFVSPLTVPFPPSPPESHYREREMRERKKDQDKALPPSLGRRKLEAAEAEVLGWMGDSPNAVCRCCSHCRHLRTF